MGKNESREKNYMGHGNTMYSVPISGGGGKK